MFVAGLPFVAMLLLEGKRALITGSSGGIGKGIALALGKAGCQVLVHYHVREAGAQQTAQELGEHRCAGIVQADFRRPEQIYDLMARQVDAIWPDGFDILVNNAGIVTKLALEDDTDDLRAWHECMAINLHAPRLLSQLALPRLLRKRQSGDGDGGGVIINVSSIHGDRSSEYMGVYAATKAALDSLTRTMALEWAPYHIRVNAIAPGVVPVERTADAFQEGSVMSELWKDKLPLRQLGRVQDVAEATVAMITNEWLTGSIWQVDGGMMARSNMPVRPRPPPL
jgi:glucose 1-dehydrogenase